MMQMQICCKNERHIFMSIKVEIIQGFIESGKTSFINTIINGEELQDEKIVVILNEYGQQEINNNFEKRKIEIISVENEIIDEKNILNIISEFNPDRIFIECNGMCDNTSVIELFEKKNLKSICKIDDIISIFSMKDFNMYYRNMNNLVIDKIKSSTSIIFNDMNEVAKIEIKKIKSVIKKFNDNTRLLNHMSYDHEEYYEELDKNLKIIKMTLLIAIMTILGIACISLSFMSKEDHENIIKYLARFYNVFVSLIIEGIPFILIGSFISGIIGIIIPKERLIGILPHNKILSCLLVSISGLFLPICDCGTIPIMKSLIKKGVNLGCAVTFMLSAPIVNPICILSTYYAFQGNISVIMYRIISGILIAVICGVIVNFAFKDTSDIFNDQEDSGYCSCDICSGNVDYNKSFTDKMFNVIDHSTNEFINVSKYMIFGMFICSIFQCTLTKNMVNPGDDRSALVIMMTMGFLLSVCSTSDAFIGKGFVSQFSINSVMGFLVVGPMIDIKNVIVLSSFFKKKFILKLLFIIFTVSFIFMINFKIA